jgi:hypothetical protein
MNNQYPNEIKEIIGEMHCPRDLLCYKSGYENLCRARDIGFKTFLECLEDKIIQCPFVVPAQESRLCQCPLRVYIAKKLNK